jgi:hypothetical protein
MADARSVQQKLSHASPSAKLLLGGSLVFVIASFLAWQSVSFETPAGDVTLTANGWHGVGTVAALCAIAVLAIEAAHLAGVQFPLDAKLERAIVASLASGILLFTIIKILDDDLGAYGRWIGLIAALVATAGGIMRLNESRLRPA